MSAFDRAAVAAPVIERLAIIGAGVEGCDLARHAARAGYQVTLEDLMPGKRRAALALLGDQAAFAHPVVLAASVEQAVREADLVIDFVPDELESKLEILSMLDRMAPPRTIFATPTRVLSIADLASCIYRPERCLALRLPELTDGGPGIEIVQPPQALPSVVEAVAGFWRILRFEVTLSMDLAALP